MAFIRTVLGDILPSALGVCLSHEHLIGRPPDPYVEPDLKLDSPSAALSELKRLRAAGGQALIEMTTPDYGQDALELRRLSEASGMHIVATAGYNKEKYSAFYLDTSVDKLIDRFTTAVQAGIDTTGVRAGVLKAASALNRISPMAEKLFRAVAQAHHQTHAPISTHAEAGTMALEQIDLLTSEGVDPSHITIGHLDRKLEWDYHLAVARRGVFMGFDQVAKEQYAPDAQRVEFITRLVAEGHGKQILLSGDQARRSYWPSYGHPNAPGLTYILERFVPMLGEAGLTQDQIDDLLINNPARAFSFLM